MISDHYKASLKSFHDKFVYMDGLDEFIRTHTITLLEKQIEWTKAKYNEYGNGPHYEGYKTALDESISYLQSEIEAIKNV